MKKRGRKPYSGILAEETWTPFGRLPVGKEKDIVEGQVLAKLGALLDHYDIAGGLDDPENGWRLSVALACDGDIVPGFEPTYCPTPKPAHRPHDLTVGARDLMLCLELGRAQLEGRSVRQDSRELAERWRKEGKCDWGWETLRQRYLLLRKRREFTEGMKEAARVLGGSS